jgi:hypothetical protein
MFVPIKMPTIALALVVLVAVLLPSTLGFSATSLPVLTRSASANCFLPAYSVRLRGEIDLSSKSEMF